MKKINYLFAFLFVVCSQLAYSQAAKATTGTGLYKDKIFWLNWDLNGDGHPNAPGDTSIDLMTEGTARTFTSPSTGTQYVVTLSAISTNQVSSWNTYIWSGNNMPSGYGDVGGTGGASQPGNIISLSNRTLGQTVSFRCSAVATYPNGTSANVAAFVVGGSEDLDPGGVSEFYELSVPTSSSSIIRYLDKYIKNNNWTNMSVRLAYSNSQRTLRITNPATSGGSRGDALMVVEDVPFVDVTLKGTGRQTIAIGFIEDVDFSDAPSSYGKAEHVVNNSISGGNFTGLDGNYNLSTATNTADTDRALFVDPLLILGNDVDTEASWTPVAAGTNPNADDLSGADDENAITIPQSMETLMVKVKNLTALPANLYVWIDANRNGTYDTNEFASTSVPVGTNGLVNLDITGITGLQMNKNYYTRIRLTTDVLTSATPSGFAKDGEVEDLWVVYVPTEGDNIDFSIDVDDDNDGIIDSNEYTVGLLDPFGDNNNDGIVNYVDSSQTGFVDSNADGVDDRYDTDLDGIINSLDLDSDNDGCVDAIEGDADIKTLQLVAAGGVASVGSGSSAINQNLCGSLYTGTSSDCVNSIGLPQITPLPSGYDNATLGQTGGTSYNNSILSNTCKCFKTGATGGTVLDTNHGITVLGRAGADNGNWPMIRKGAWTAIEAKSKGFVINRVHLTADLANITPAVEGMIVYDEEADCLKIYTKNDDPATTFSWRCFNTQTCPDIL